MRQQEDELLLDADQRGRRADDQFRYLFKLRKTLAMLKLEKYLLKNSEFSAMLSGSNNNISNNNIGSGNNGNINNVANSLHYE